ncbi:myocardin-related transcription factor A-like [Leuresthes tenuis]|uniref:myocardin-related transcription factor A-like n=1 Tax=Leuresthes tenuis TaxID=355514 RepID=UPI003B50BC66
MLDHLQRVNINPAHFRPQPISSSMDERDIRFELERQACQSLRKVLQLKLQQRKTREELVRQGIMPPLKGSAAFHEQRRSLERARTEDYLKRKIRSRPERSKLIRMHIMEEPSTEPLLQAKQLQLKRARLAGDLNDKIAHRPGPMELIQKNILPVHSRIKEAIIETQFPKASGENSSCDEDSNDSLSPGPVSLDYPLGPGAVCFPTEKLAGSSIQSPAQAPPPALHFPSISGSFTALKLTNRTVASSAQRTGANFDIKPQSKPNSDRLSQKHKKTKDNKPKIKKLKYHQYIPPDQKGDKEPPPHLDSSYAKILQQQQLFLQLQILSQQQQHYNYHSILPAPPKDQKPSSNSMSTSSPPRPAAVSSPVLCDQLNYICVSSAPSAGTKAASVHPNLDGMKVAELKSELKLRSLPVSGTKNNLIERLKTYQELNRGGDTTSSQTPGGTTGPGPEGGGRSSKKAETNTTNNGTLQEEQFQLRQASSLNATPERLKRCGGNIKPRSITPAPMSPKGIRFNSNLVGELISSPFTEMSLQPSSVTVHIKEEPPCSTQAPCQFSLKSASLQKHCFASSPAPSSTTAASLGTIDKDKMLQEKDKQIAELTRRLRQKQRLVEVLKMQLELGNREGQVPEPLILRRVKEEPPDHEPFPPQVSSLSSEMNANKLTVKQEAVEIEIGGSEPSVQSSDAHGLLQSFTQNKEAQHQMHLQLKPEQKSVKKKQELVCLHQPALQLAQQQAIQKLLQQQRRQQHSIQNHIQMSEPQQKLCLQGQKKSQNLLPKQHEQQKQRLASQQQHQQSVPKQPKQQVSLSQRQFKQQQTKQLQQIQIQTKIHLKQQQRLHSTPAELPSIYPAQVTRADSGTKRVGFLKQFNSKFHFIFMKVQNEALQLSVEQPQQGAAHCLSAPPSLQPFFKDQQPAASGKISSSPPAQTEMCADLDALLSPLSPASIRTAASQPDDKQDTENQDDFIDIILQAGGMSTTFRPAPDTSLDHLNANSSASSPTPSPLHLLLSSPIAAGGDSPQYACSPQHTTSDTRDEKQQLGICTNGRLEDFLESTTGKPLLGVEPGGLLTLIDDLHSQLLCTPSILDRAPSPMDTFEMAGEGGQGLDSTDWLDLNMGDERDEETPTLAPLGPQTPLSVFSTDFLDSSDLHIHWGSCP